MLLNVKVLGGSECQVEASPDTCVDHLKTLVESKLSFAKSDQKLLYKGKTLQDGVPLSQYQICDGDKINLIVKRESNISPDKNLPSTSSESESLSVDSELFSVIRKHFRTDEEASQVVKHFRLIYREKLSRLSFHDWERIAVKYESCKSLTF